MADTLKALPVGAYFANGKVYDARNMEIGLEGEYDPTLPRVSDPMLRAAYDPAYAYTTPGDIRRQQAQNAREFGIASGIGLLGTVAQTALTMAPNEADTENEARLAALKEREASGRMGLDDQERAELDRALLAPARAAVTESRQRGEALASSMGNTDAASQRRVMESATRAGVEAEQRAGVEIARQNAEARARNQQELQERIAEKAKRQVANVEAVGKAIGDVANVGGKVLAAQATKRQMTDAEIQKLIDSGKDPTVAGMKVDDARKVLDQQQKEREAAERKPLLGWLTKPKPDATTPTTTGYGG